MSTIKSLRFDISSNWDGAGIARAREELDALKRDLDEIDGRDARARVTVDVQNLDEVRAQLDALAQSRTAAVNTNLQGADAARAQLDALAQSRTAAVNTNLTGDDAARARLDGLTRARTAAVNTNLTGDSSARTRLDDLARTRTAPVRVTADGVDALRAKLDDLARLRQARINADLVGDAEVRARLDNLIRARKAEIRADLQDAGVAARLDVLTRTRHARIIVDVDKSKLDEVRAALDDLGNKFDWARGRAANLAAAITAIAPAIVPLSAAILGLSGAIVSGFGAATLALVPFGASMLGTIKSSSQLANTISSLKDQLQILHQAEAQGIDEHKKIVETQLKLNQAMKQATPIQREVASSMMNLSDSWHKFQTVAEKSTGPILASGFNAVTAALPKMIPLVQAVAPLFQRIADEANKFASSNGMTKFVDWIVKVGVPDLKNIMDTIGHLFVTIGQIIKAFAPQGEGFTKWLSDVTKKLNEWGSAGGFQRFADKVTKDWPQIKKLLEEGGLAIANIVKALAGLGPASVSGLTLILEAVAKMSPGQVQALAVAFMALKTALLGISVVSGALAAFDSMSTTVTRLGAAMTTLGNSTMVLRARLIALAVGEAIWNGVLALSDMLALPLVATIGLIVVALAALAFGVYELVTHWQGFTHAMGTAWRDTWNAIKLVSDTIWNGLKIAWSATTQALSTAWSAVSGALTAAWNATWNGIKTAFGAVTDFLRSKWALVLLAFGPLGWLLLLAANWKSVWNGIKTASDAVWNALKTAWHAVASSFSTSWTAVSGALKTAWSATWNGLKTAATTVWNALKTAWNATAHGFSTAWTAVSGALKTAWNATWNGLKTAAQAVWNWMKSTWNTTAHAFSTAWSAVSGALKAAWSATWNGLKTAAQAVWNWMKSTWNTVAHAFSTAWSAVSGALKSAWDATWNALKNTANTVWNAIKTGWSKFANDILAAIGNWVIKAAEGVAKFFTSLAKHFVDGLKKLGEILLKGGGDVAKQLIEGLIHGLESGVGGLLGKVMDVGKKVVDGFKSIFHINSPSKDTEDIGHGLHEGLALGLDKGMVLSLTATARVGIQVINSLKSSFKSMDQVGIQAMQQLVAGFQAGMQLLLVIIQQFGPKATAAFKTTFAQLKTTATQTMTEVNSAVQAGMTQLQATFTTSQNTIKASWSTFVKTFKTAWTTEFNSLKTQWTTDWNTLKTTGQTVWNTIKTAWTTFTKTFLTAWNTAFAALKAKWTTDWTSLKTSGQTVWDSIKTAWTTFTKTFLTEWTTAFNALKAQWTTDWTAMKTGAQTIWDAMKTAWTKFGADLNSAWTTASNTLQAAWKQAWTNMNSTAKSEWATITTTIGTAVNKIIGIVNSLIKAWNAVAGAVDLPSISPASPASFAQGGIVGYADGGMVGSHIGVNLAGGGVLGGYEPGHDSVPAILSKGEGVLVPEAVRGLGEGFVHGANHHFSGGRAGSPGGGFSGGRQHFATGGIAGGGGVATGAFGLPDPAAVKSMFDPLIKQLQSINGWSHGAGVKFGDVGQKMEDKLIQAIQAKIAAMMAAMAAAAGQGTAVSGTVKNLSALALAALKQAGIPASQLANFLKRIMIESSGNPNAINNWDINAKNGIPSQGLGQIIPPNFSKYHAAGTSSNILDPTANLYASANYIKAVYGGKVPTGAAYANGTSNAARGWGLVGEEGPEMVNFGGGEQVLTADQTRMAMSGGGGGGTTISVSIDARGSTPESVDKLKSEAIPQLRMALQAGVGKKGR